MRIKPTKENAEKSRAYKKAKSKANDYANDPEKLKKLLDDAAKKADAKKGPLKEVWDTLMAFFRLLRAYAKREYTAIPTYSLVMIITAVLYFISPIDLIPDFIPVAGFVDDAAVLGWTMKAFRSDIEAFMDWETNRA